MDNYEAIREKMLIAMNGSGFSKNEAKNVAQMLDFIMKDYELTTRQTGMVVYDGNVTEQLVEYFLQASFTNDQSDKTISTRRQTLNRFFRMVGKSPTEVEHQDIYTYKYLLLKDGVAGNTINTYLSTISSFYNWAVKRHIVSENPIESEDKLREKDKEKLPLTDEQVKTIREAIETMDDRILFRAMFEFLLSTGLRREELTKAKKSDIIWDMATDTAVPIVVPCGKGGKERYTFISLYAIKYIKRYLDTRKDDNELLFLNRKGTPLATNVVNMMFRQIRNVGGIPFLTPHTLRRTFATHAVQNGVSINAVARTMGHASISTTMIYAKDTLDSLMTQFEKVNVAS